MSVIQALNLPLAQLKLKKRNSELYVWCIIRKKQLLLTPEEWVRQHFIHFLTATIQIPIERIASEYGITVNNLTRRCDLVVFNKEGNPKMIVECKATSVAINQEVFYQIAQYNRQLQVNYLVLTNGLEHFFAKIDADSNQLTPLTELKKEWFD
ncbi:MAG: type I restriction enzyme HsdR N-terminal domain-containing protein [Crocinitomicaceae bacterium]|nr:type I restriction enzyme HsdR N-terminal domain-containing protein [Crocinitomicaceae bacterium]